MTRADYEPLIDKIRSRFLSWSSRALSYAGCLQLINSVIVSITNFWCSVFCMPKRCLETIEIMCRAFLWSGSPHSNTKAKVAWLDVCKPKSEGGLGIRRMADSSPVFALGLIWRLLTNSGSLWVAWTKQNLLCRRCFWDVTDTGSGRGFGESFLSSGYKLLHLYDLKSVMEGTLYFGLSVGCTWRSFSMWQVTQEHSSLVLLVMQPRLGNGVSEDVAAITYRR